MCVCASAGTVLPQPGGVLLRGSITSPPPRHPAHRWGPAGPGAKAAGHHTATTLKAGEQLSEAIAFVLKVLAHNENKGGPGEEEEEEEPLRRVGWLRHQQLTKVQAKVCCTPNNP